MIAVLLYLTCRRPHIQDMRRIKTKDLSSACEGSVQSERFLEKQWCS